MIDFITAQIGMILTTFAVFTIIPLASIFIVTLIEKDISILKFGIPFSLIMGIVTTSLTTLVMWIVLDG